MCDGNVVNLANFDYPPEQFNQAFGLISHDGRRPKVIIGFEIYSTLTFGKIKTITREQMIDVVSIGHLHGKHPRFADIDGLHAQVEAFFIQATLSLEAMTKFPLFYDEDKLNLL